MIPSRDPNGYYEQLGVTPDASFAEIRRAYRLRAWQTHPDRNQNPDATSHFQELQQAFNLLSSPEKRRRYDVHWVGPDATGQAPGQHETAPVFDDEVLVGTGTRWLKAAEDGLYIEGLGAMDWGAVISLHMDSEMPDELLIYTESFGKLAVHSRVDELAPILWHHISSYEDLVRTRSGVDPAAELRIKALPFSWPAFRYCTWLGYAVGVYIFFAMASRPDYGGGFFKTVFLPFLISGMSTLLIWRWTRLSLHDRGGMRIFRLQDRLLRSVESEYKVDLTGGKVHLLSRAGLGYKLEFVAVRPVNGPAVDLLVDLPDMRGLYKRLSANQVLGKVEWGYGYGQID